MDSLEHADKEFDFEEFNSLRLYVKKEMKVMKLFKNETIPFLIFSKIVSIPYHIFELLYEYREIS